MIEGGCHCGTLRYRIDGEPLLSALCHCPDCRRSVGAPIVAWATFPLASLTVMKGETTKYASSHGVERQFCGRCGSSLFFLADYMPGLIDVTIASFDAPELSSPSAHIWNKHRLTWMSGTDTLKVYDEAPPSG